MLPLTRPCVRVRPKTRDYRDLIAWQQAMELAVECEHLCGRLPPRASSVASQIRRSATSIPANIAEGNGRFSRADYLRHLSIAHGSLKELESHLHYISRVYRPGAEVDAAVSLSRNVGRLLGGLIRSLQPRVGES